MNWQKIAIEDLRNHAAYTAALQTLEEDVYKLEHESIGIKSALASTDTIKSSSKSTDDKLLNNIVMLDKLKQQLRTTRYQVARVTRGLEVLSESERICLAFKYIYPRKNAIDNISDRLNIERATVYRAINSAMLKFTRSMYGAPNS